MILKVVKFQFIICLVFWIFIQEGKTDTTKTKRITHKIAVHHPGKGIDNIENVNLIEEQNKKGIPLDFYMDVESVICLEKVCKVVSVRLYWNNIGEYQKYKLKKGVTLEKYEDDLFDKEDYKKLDKILATTDSPFKNVNIDEILTVVDIHDENVDAVSGATALELDEDETVPGAALTCYTLWHWANGDVIQIIRDISGKSFKEKHFKAFLNKNEAKYPFFALEQLAKNKIVSNELLDIVIDKASTHQEFLKPSINYFESLEATNYYSAIKKLFIKGDKAQKIASLNSMLNNKLQTPKGFLDNFSRYVSELDSYREVSTFLRLMENKNPNSAAVIKSIFPLLEKDLLTARRAYWFLKNKNLNKSQKNKINAFYEKHKEVL